MSPQSVDDNYERVLGIETSTSIQSIAVLEGEETLEDARRRVPFDHSSSLLDNLAGGLEELDLEIADLDLVACGIGPGSFTGVRIGVSLGKALARGAELPIVGVSSLATQAFPQAIRSDVDRVIAAVDARRSRVYTGSYGYAEDGWRKFDEDREADPGDVRSRALDFQDDGHAVQVVGNAVEAFETIESLADDGVEVLPAWAHAPTAAATAALGRRRAAADGTDELDKLEPNYIRPSSAEENREGDE